MTLRPALDNGRSNMAERAPRKCKGGCGTPMPPDKRLLFCLTCRGARVKRQDNKRKAKQHESIGEIDYDLLGLAVRMKLQDIRDNDPRVTELVNKIAVEEANAPEGVVAYAARGRVLRLENLTRVLKWLGKTTADFQVSAARTAARARFNT